MAGTKYDKQRDRRTPPHVPLHLLRAAAGLTLDQVCERMTEISGRAFSRGALSAIENGHRGASQATLDALSQAFGLQPGSITTDYVPREREAVAS